MPRKPDLTSIPKKEPAGPREQAARPGDASVSAASWYSAYAEIPNSKLRFSAADFRLEAAELLAAVRDAKSIDEARGRAIDFINQTAHDLCNRSDLSTSEEIIGRHAARIWRNLLSLHAEQRSDFSTLRALIDLAGGKKRADLSPGFFAELTHLWRAVAGDTGVLPAEDDHRQERLSGREAARCRSNQLDRFWVSAKTKLERYRHGLEPEFAELRRHQRRNIRMLFDASLEQWNDWHWQAAHVIKDPELIARAVSIPAPLFESVCEARRNGLPFGVTPFYLSLFDPQGRYDQALRAIVLPPPDYVAELSNKRESRSESFDFMREHDTSPVDLVTRRYPNIAIFKPYNTCPQICVYCQRNWEIDDAMDPHAMASAEKIDAAIKWLAAHPAIYEILFTGGDPLVMSDRKLKEILDRLAAIPHVERIRIGTRTPVTMPMRITDKLVELLGSYREPGRREICVITHIEHPFEVNQDMVSAVERLRRRGIPVYNQHVYTFYSSRRFEAVALRRLLRLIGVDSYYTFNAKGKEETAAYRVPIARLLQEQREEARLSPGLVRSDEAVYNVPALGKNYIRAAQDRELLAILPDGSRLYEFHPWEKFTSSKKTYVARDVSILSYLKRLEAIGEDPDDYATIWYHY